MMAEKICERCHENPATVTITELIGDEKKLLHLCQACAELNENVHFPSNIPEFFENAVKSILGAEAYIAKNDAGSKRECVGCHLTLEEFENNGLLGCPLCYDAFKDEMELLLRRIHGSNKHIGSRPRPQRVFGTTPDLAALKDELREAIEQENYERAAEYRDLIRDLEREAYREEPS